MSALCEHERLGDHCEDCALVKAIERGYRPAEHPQAPAPPELDLAEQHLLVEIGSNTYVQVMAGDDIPHAVRALPRVDRATLKPLKGRPRKG